MRRTNKIQILNLVDTMKKPLKHFILDVDGVMTDGTFAYTADGKVAKVFGPHDADGLKLIRDKIAIQFISADKRGFPISHKRIVQDMGYPLTYVTESDRYDYVKKFGFDQTAFMGDGYYDAPVIKECAVGIAPSGSRIEAQRNANFVSASRGGSGAVMDACLFILSILEPDDD